MPNLDLIFHKKSEWTAVLEQRTVHLPRKDNTRLPWELGVQTLRGYLVGLRWGRLRDGCWVFVQLEH